MQGKKDYQEKRFTDFRLSDRIPKENFYRRLKDCLNLAATAYNLKKYLNFINKTPIPMAEIVKQAKKGLQSAFLAVKWSLWGKKTVFSRNINS